MSNIIEHKKFICVAFGSTNNNKFWEYTLYSDGTALTKWGRVGGHISEKTTTERDALAKMRKKTNLNNAPDKLYSEVKVAEGVTNSSSSQAVSSSNLKSIAQKQIDIKDPTLKELVDFLVKANVHNILSQSGGSIQYDTSTAQFKTPLGVIMPDQVLDARDLLNDIANLVVSNDYDNRRFNSLLQDYLRLVPHAVGMQKISPKLIFPNSQSLQTENDLLDGLTASFNDIQSGVVVKDKKKKKVDIPKLFDVTLDVVRDRATISKISNRVDKTRKKMHSCSHLKLQKIYSINIKPMYQAFEKDGKDIGNIQSLYHGTRTHHILSILKQGLIIPSSSSPHITGSLFGRGCYFASSATKSLNYSYGYWDRSRNSRCFMFITDVAMGSSYIPKNRHTSFPQKGYDSTWAKADISGVLNDEFIVYRPSQANFTHILEFNK